MARMNYSLKDGTEMAILLGGTFLYKGQYVLRVEFLGGAFHVQYWGTKLPLIIVKVPDIVSFPTMKGPQSLFVAANSLKPFIMNVAIRIF
jgi:hypothetical protein